MTARWAVDIADARELDIRWRPISLLVKNRLEPGNPGYERVEFSHRTLRVMEAVRVAAGDRGVSAWYTELGRRMHHDRTMTFDLGDALAAAGLDPELASAADDPAWDAAIDSSMSEGLALAGNDIGTPIVAWTGSDGQRHGIFGPVITRVPGREDRLRLWDAMVEITEIPGFWELKRTRTERPDVGPRP